jgi:hypothetical protein
VTNTQEGKRGIHGRIDARHQAAKFFLFVQPVTRLPRFAASEWREAAPHLVQSVEDRCVDRPMYLRPQPALPHEGGEQPHDLRGFDPEFVFGGHDTFSQPGVGARRPHARYSIDPARSGRDSRQGEASAPRARRYRRFW